MSDKKVVATQSVSTVEHVVAGLRERIRGGLMMPGQRLVEADITHDMGVSRSSAREALRRLAAEGLVEIQHQRGARVRQMTRQEILALYEIRELLEGLAARGAAVKLSQSGRQEEFEEILTDLKTAEEAGAVAPYLEGNLRFHDFIVELSGNAHLPRLLNSLQTPIVRYQFRSVIDANTMRKSNDDHQSIASAIKSGDPDAADQAMRAHVREAAESILDMPEMMFAPA
ncbi:MAG: GntR family transcriptional regulator [Parvibaculaceae bacterium]